MQRNMQRVRAQAGFSLIEILMAITIIGIMAAGMFGVLKYLKRAKRSSTELILKHVAHAIDTFHEDTGVYPAQLLDLIVRPADEKVAKGWKGDYLDEKEVRPDAWKNELQYQVAPKGTKPPYELWSCGENGDGSPSEEWIRA